MTTNIWTSKRFVKVEDDVYNILCKHLVILTEIVFWAENADEIEAWCSTHNCHIQGMTIEIPDDETYTLFCLQWS